MTTTIVCLLLGFLFLGWIVRRERRKPADPLSCLGSNPGPQDRAENDCESCPSKDDCLPAPAKVFRPNGDFESTLKLEPYHSGGFVKGPPPVILNRDYPGEIKRPKRPVGASPALGAPYTPSPSPAPSEDPYLAAAVANAVFATYIDTPSAPDPTPDPTPDSSSSDFSGGGGDFGGGGSDSSW